MSLQAKSALMLDWVFGRKQRMNRSLTLWYPSVRKSIKVVSIGSAWHRCRLQGPSPITHTLAGDWWCGLLGGLAAPLL